MQEQASFASLGLSSKLLQAVDALSFTTPSPIQVQTIPPLLAGQDVLGQAKTGTGKTAAFALPILQHVDVSIAKVQYLVLAPTRELAIQVADAFTAYAAFLPSFKVVAVFGGGDYRNQLQQIKKGAQVVVGTPGRVMDHMRRGSLNISELKGLVLDEADEMLRMGFIDDVEWILSHTPNEKQTALFSATMPKSILALTDNYLNTPVRIAIQTKTATVERIRQHYLMVNSLEKKIAVLTYLLEGIKHDAVLVFVKTKQTTLTVAEHLKRCGFKTESLNGDIVQSQRKRTVDGLKTGRIDVVVATDVAARGIDIERINWVVNFDMPFDVETYVHRIGRTARAGREGDAVSFVLPREKGALKRIEKHTQSAITSMELPTVEEINNNRIADFKARLHSILEQKELGLYQKIVTDILDNSAYSADKVAAALAKMAEGTKSLFIRSAPKLADPRNIERGSRQNNTSFKTKRSFKNTPTVDMLRYRLEVGYKDGVKPGNIVGAIANEAGLDSQHIGHIVIDDKHSFVELPKGMPKAVFNELKKARVCGKQMRLSRC